MTAADFQSASDRVMALLPSMYRIADAQPTTADGYLHTLMGLIGEQVAELEDDLAVMYDDLFIETCAPWAVPYIGELVGVLPAREIDGDSLTTRAQVAEVIALRRRKGTADVIEELAQAITGWASRVVEMYAHVATTQNLNHRRPQATTLSLRSNHPESIPNAPLSLELTDSAFDPFMHNVDIRWIRSGRGRYNTQNLAIFLWPQVDLRFASTDAVEVDPQRFRFHPLGIDTTLVTRRVDDAEVLRAAEIDEVPWPISRRILDTSLAQSLAPDNPEPGLYGPEASLLVETAEGVVGAEDILVCALGDVGDGSGDWEHVDAVEADQVAVDPQLGRIALGANRNGPVTASMTQSLTGPIGGGYVYRLPFDLADDPFVVVERDGAAGTHATVAAALGGLGGAGGNVLLVDSRTYTESPVVSLDQDAILRVSADGSTRPTLVASDGLRIVCAEGSSVELDGLVIAGGPLVISGRPDTITLRDCTVVPGHQLEPDLTPVHPNQPSIVIQSDDDVTPELTLERTITGPILTPAASSVTARDCIIEGGTAGGATPRLQLMAVTTDLSALPDLGPAPNLLTILVSGHDPVTADVADPATIAELAAAIDAAGPDPDVLALVRGARIVVAAESDLSIRPGAPDDTTAATLGLLGDGARRSVVGLRRDAPPVFDATEVTVALRAGTADPITLDLADPLTTLDEVAVSLEVAIRAVGPDPAFADALAFVSANRLVVVPGDSEQRWTLEGTAADPTSAHVIGLASDFPAIASDGYGDSGPDITLERVTVLGSVRATTATLVSDSILAGPLIADRGQEGCIRFCYVAHGSTTPRRYRCVPDHDCDPRLAIASDRYGDARYCELVATESMVPVRYGSSAGDEMGAFSSFAHRRREQTLTFNLEEFMRFSMEAGLLDGRKTLGG